MVSRHVTVFCVHIDCWVQAGMPEERCPTMSGLLRAYMHKNLQKPKLRLGLFGCQGNAIHPVLRFPGNQGLRQTARETPALVDAGRGNQARPSAQRGKGSKQWLRNNEDSVKFT